MPTQTLKFSYADIKEALQKVYPQLQTGKTMLWDLKYDNGGLGGLHTVTIEVQINLEPYGINTSKIPG